MAVFDSNGKLPGKRLAVRTVVAHPARIELGEFIERLMHEQAQQAARLIVHEPSFFSFNERHGTVECRCDIVVISLDDLVSMKRAAFAEGVRHANGFMSDGPR